MDVVSARFDLGSLYRAVDSARLDHELSWSALSRRVGVAASTIRRLESADDAEADGVLTVTAWLGVDPEEFISGRRGRGHHLPPFNGGVIRVDTSLLTALAPGAVRSGGRTTIQRLTRIAQLHARSIASLARWSAI